MKRVNLAAIILAALLSTMACTSAATPSSGAASSGGTAGSSGGPPATLSSLVVGTLSVPNVLCACQQSGRQVAEISAQLFASPVLVPSSLSQPQPYVAKSWSVSPDGLTVTLHIDPSAKFSDGQPITSADIAFSISQVKKYHGFGPQLFGAVASVDTSDPATAVIHLSHPDPALFVAMTPPLLPILPEHIYGNSTDLKTDPRMMQNVVSSGPYRLVSYTPNEQIVLAPNPDFFMKNWTLVKQLVIKQYSDENTMAIALSSGEAQMADIEDPGIVANLQGNKNVQVSPVGGEAIGGINWLEFNTKAKYLQDVAVRQAIAYGTDVNAIIKDLQHGVTKPAPGPIAPGLPEFNASAVVTYPYDPQKANQLLDSAGYPRGADGTRFNLTLDVDNLNPPAYSTLLAQELKSQLAQIGIGITLREGPAASEYPLVSNYKYDIFINDVFNWGDPSIGVARTYLCSNIRPGVMFANMSQYCNPQVDQLLTAAASEVDQAKRQSDYDQFQHIITQDVPIRFLTTESFHVIAKAGIAGLPTGPWGVMAPFYDLSAAN